MSDKSVNKFGEFLRAAREKIGIKQKDVADEISKVSTKKVSQGLIAQYESGKISFPDSEILKHLSDLYKVGWGELALWAALSIIQKYENAGVNFTEQEKEQVQLWEYSLNKFASARVNNGFEKDSLSSTIEFFLKFKVVSAKDLAKWQRTLKELSEFWVITPNFLDNNDKDFINAVLYNLGRNVTYVYFIRESDAQRGGKFSILKNTLVRLASNLDKPIAEEKVNELIRPVKIPENDLRLVQTDIVIANPQSMKPIGFRSIRDNGIPVFAVKVCEDEISTIVGQMADYAIEKEGENIFSFARKSA